MNRRVLPLLITLFLFHGSGFVFGQAKYWMQQAGGVTPDEGYDISIDNKGNTYTTGYFTGTATFGSATLISSGVTDVFIAKLDSLGQFVWAVKAGGAGSDRGLSIKADAFGNSYITGYYYGTATFGSQTITSAGVQDVFIAKYNTAGVLQWVSSGGGSESDIGNGISVDDFGNVLLTGEFSGISTLGSFTITSKNNSVDVFIARLDANGNFLWVKTGAASQTDRGVDIGADKSGNVYVTGQFSDTITFDVTHTNNAINSIFLIKYDSTGHEQWFKRIGGGTMNVAYALAVDANANVYLTGDFTGTLIFFDITNTPLSNTYPNRIFVAKYDSIGSLQWAHADGSNAELTSRNLALDAAGNPFVIGDFKCRMNEYADKYGQGTFNSVGYWDIFVSGYSTSGTWNWSRQCASRSDDYGAGIAVSASGKVHVTGSFSSPIIFPRSDDFIGYNTDSIPGGAYCGDNNYYVYNSLTSKGSSDILIASDFDLAKSTYDYYGRSTGCTKPYVGVCITDGLTSCPDTANFCKSGVISANSHVNAAGPGFTYVWNTGETTGSITVNTAGYYSVTQTSADGCFVSTDSIYVAIHPFPVIPFISDDHGINTSAIITEAIILCSGSVQLTGGNFGTSTFFWVTPSTTLYTSTITAAVTGRYTLSVTNKFGCNSENFVNVTIGTIPLPKTIPKMVCLTDIDGNDSVSICAGKNFKMLVYDSVSNPMGGQFCIPNGTHSWSVSPHSIGFSKTDVDCIYAFSPKKSGTYIITDTIIRVVPCNSDTTWVSRKIYVNVLPLPVITTTVSLSGDSILCPADSALLVAVGKNLMWQGSGIDGKRTDSVWVHKQGMYIVTSTDTITNASGCTGSATAADSIFVKLNPLPTIIMNMGKSVICPNDSIQLACDGTGHFHWQGPLGPVGTDTSIIYVKDEGLYYCIRTDKGGCELVSNTVEAKQYSLPYLLPSPRTILCPGDTIVITAIADTSSIIQWQSPLSGSSASQFVTTPGVYTCSISSCSIQTIASVTITLSGVSAVITASGPLAVCVGDSIILHANLGMTNYLWQPGGYTQPSIVVSSPGTYSLSTTDSIGCTATAMPVKISSTPLPVVKVNSATICEGQSVTLTATGATTYTWSTAAVTNAINVSPAANESYTVTGTANSCSDTAVAKVNIVTNTLAVPTVKSTSVCPESSATLTASGTGTLLWYDLPGSGATLLSTGSVYKTPNLNSAITYYVLSQDTFCKSGFAPVTVDISDCDTILPPNVFTPNNDGVNDVFKFDLKDTKCFSCKIYDRWGVLIYEWDDPKGAWNGTVKQTGRLASDGVYYYILDYCTYSNKSKQRAGFVQLIKG